MKQNKLYSGLTNAAVLKATGKSWDEWFALLDKDEAYKLPHKQIAELIYEKHMKKGWWCQAVTVGYEQAKGLRKVHQTANGFNASISKTFPFPLPPVFDAWANNTKREKWLGEKDIEITSVTENKYFHAKWNDGTKVTVGFYAKDENRSMVALEHSKLKNEKEVQDKKEYWKKKLEKLYSYLS